MGSKLFGKLNGRYLHGMYGTRPYRIWSSMLTRCNNPKSKSYKDYGGRGIKVCKKWLSFMGFWEDVKKGYSDKLTIDRINNDGNYSKENCRWVTRTKQGNNKKNNVYLTFNGERKTVAQWITKIGINKQTLWARINRGWSIEKALITSVRKKHCKFNKSNK